MYPHWSREVRDARFAELRRRQARESAALSPEARLARADQLLRSVRALRGNGRVVGGGTDETLELWRSLRASWSR